MAQDSETKHHWRRCSHESFKAQPRHSPNQPIQLLRSPSSAPAAWGSTLSSARLFPFSFAYRPHFQSCPCLYLFSSSKCARILSSSPLSSMLRLPGTCWLPPGSRSVMGLEWRNRYWSSSLLQQVEKHLNEEHQSQGTHMPLGKDSLEGGVFAQELVLAAPGLKLRSSSARLGSWRLPRASDSKQWGRKTFLCPGWAGTESQDP